MRVGGIVDISTVDWKGNVCFIVFLTGCNFKCPYCQNKQIISRYSGKEISIDEIEQRLIPNKKLLDAVVLSGGEPTLQENACIEIFKLARKHNLKTCIETNGSKPKTLKKLIKMELLDHITLDFKTSPHKYHLVNGESPVDTIIVLDNLRSIYDFDFEIRTTIDGDIVDSDDLNLIKDIIPDYCRWTLQEKR